MIRLTPWLLALWLAAGVLENSFSRRSRYAASYHHVLWEGKDNNGQPAASGVYLYQLRAGEFAQVKKTSLVR